MEQEHRPVCGADLRQAPLRFPTCSLVTLGFLAFCALASGAYVMNDLRDCERDREHPLKSLRPLPSGRVRRGTAVVLSIALVVAGLMLAGSLGRGFAVLAGLYFVLQVAYTFWLKEVVILDVMSIAAGFVIRAVAGGVIIEVPVSPWLIICTFLLVLFLGFSKRRHELILLEGAGHRPPRQPEGVQPVLPRPDDRRGDRVDRGGVRHLHGVARSAREARHRQAVSDDSVRVVRDLSLPVPRAPTRRRAAIRRNCC